MKQWTVKPLNKAEINRIQNEYGISPILATMLQIRNINTREEIEDFLYNETEIASPFEIKDMKKAAERVSRAVENGELICVYGDYDADGVTSTALLYSYLETIGANVIFYIPSREAEGYGMNRKAVDTLKSKGVELIVTVDNGIAAVSEIDYANSLGIDTVVTDHHTPQETLPNAAAVVDLHQKDCPSRFKHLSGVGVAFKLMMALEGDADVLLENYADIVCLGTIGDIVELKGENRVFVKRGLQSLSDTDRPGIAALISASGLDDKPITVGNVSFQLVPRINAVGRLGRSENSVRLLLTDDPDEAERIAGKLDSDNYERKKIESDILEEIDKKIKNNPLLVQRRVIVIDGLGWRPGVVGIVASRIKEIYGKPVIVIADDGKNAKASGRSVEGFPLHTAVAYCADLLQHHGGHPMAAGLSLESKNIAAFREKINEFAVKFGEMPFDTLNIDCKLKPEFISLDILDDLSLLQPYGAGNPTPVFGLYNMKIRDITPLKDDKHLKLLLTRDGVDVTAMLYNTSSREFGFKRGDVIDLAVNLEINNYNGKRYPSVKTADVKDSREDTRAVIESGRVFEDLNTGVIPDRQKLSEILPDRADFAAVYRFLRSNGGWHKKTEALLNETENISYGKIRVILEAMKQLGLIEMTEGIKQCDITLNSVSGKVDLESAAIIRKIKGEL